MPAQKDFLDRMRIASPCSVGWQNMAGDERVRFCNQCSLNVYNISAMTREEVALLIKSAEGRICARLYRRVDGTVLTRDCPVGLRAFRRRISKMAGAALTAVLALCTGAFGQGKSQEDKTCEQRVIVKTKKATDKGEKGTVSGVVTDVNGGVIPGANVTLISQQTEDKLKTVTTDEGAFKFSNIVTGEYTLEIEVAGFKTLKLKDLKVNSDEVVKRTLILELSGETVTIGIVAIEPEIESTNGTTIIRDGMIQNLPLP
jgi:hypothetical protein